MLEKFLPKVVSENVSFKICLILTYSWKDSLRKKQQISRSVFFNPSLILLWTCDYSENRINSQKYFLPKGKQNFAYRDFIEPLGG